MNKIYKVVWSKVKNCYVVVSEIAKNVINGSVKSAKIGSDPITKGLALGALMTMIITGQACAESVFQGKEYSSYNLPPSTLGNITLEITSDNENYDGNVFGIRATDDIEVKVGNVSGTVESTSSWTGAFEATDGAVISLNSVTNLSVNGAQEAYGINVARSGAASVNGNFDATVSGGEWVSGLEAYNGSVINLGNADSVVALTVTANSETSSDTEYGVRAHGIFACGQTENVYEDGEIDEVAHGGSTIRVNASELTVSSTSKYGMAYGICADDKGVVEADGVVNLTATGYSAYGVEALNGSTVELGNTGKDVSINATSTGENGEAIAVYAGDNSRIDIIADTLNVNIENIYDGGSLQAKRGSTISVNANNATIHGIVHANEGSMVDLSQAKNLRLTADEMEEYDITPVVQAKNGGKVVVGSETGKTEVIGDVFAHDSGQVDLCLTTADSVLDGSTYTKLPEGVTDNNSENEDGVVNLILSNGAIWNVTGDSTLTTLAGTSGVINKADDAPQDVTLHIVDYRENNIHDGEGIYSGVALTNESLKVTNVKLVVDTYETSIYNSNVKIESNSDVSINSQHDDGICVYGNVEINGKNVTITANDNGIKSADADKVDNNDNGVPRLEDGNVTINATGNVSVKSLREGYAITNVSENKGRVEIKANGNVELASPDRSAVRVGEAYDGHTFNGVVDVTGQSITIQGKARMHDEGEFEPSAAYAKGAGVLNLTASDTVTITDGGSLENGSAIGAFAGGIVNINGAANVVANGNVYATGEGSKINFANTGSVTVNGDINLTNKAVMNLGNANIGGAVNVDNGATWNLTGASFVIDATFGSDSTLVINGADFVEKTGKYALNGVDAKYTVGSDLTIENGAKLTVIGIDSNVYNIAKGFTTISENKWDVTNLNTLMEGKWVEDESKGLQLQVVAKEAGNIGENLGVSETTGEFLSNLAGDAGDAIKNGYKENDGTPQGKLVGLANAAANSKNPVVVAKAAETLQKMAEAGGNSATAANVVNNVTNVTGQRMSFTGGNNGNKGGHGVGLLEEGSGAAIWAQYVHGKDSVEDMPSEAGASSYEGQYNGIVMGIDFKKVGKFQSGVAFNYGEGDTHSVNTSSLTRSDYDFWGVGYYGNIRNADSNVIFDIGYAKTDSDVTSNILGTTFEASPETTTWTAGVKVEKLYQNNNVQIVPYTGLRYMSIDPEDYTTKCGAMGYKVERQDIWMLPLGVSIRQEVVNNNGWVVTPKVDLSYIWAFGDTNSTMETNTVFGTDNRPFGYDVMDDGSWLGLVGVEAAMDDWTFGVSYSYQKGDHSESKKWYVDAKYTF